MESSKMSIQIPLVEILTILANRHLKVDQMCNPIEFLLNVSPAMDTLEICCLIEHEDDEVSRKDSVVTFKIVPERRENMDQNKLGYRFPLLEYSKLEMPDGPLIIYLSNPEISEQKIKKKSRKPGPNLRPY